MKYVLIFALGVATGVYGISGMLGIGKTVVSSTAKVGSGMVSGVAK